MSIVNDLYPNEEPNFDSPSYLDWLESFTIDPYYVEGADPTYHYLIKTLWDIPFHGSIGNDDDRGADGIELRIRYDDILAKKIGIDDNVMPQTRGIFGPCRVLEMLIALSMRMCDICQDLVPNNSVSRWFWEIMVNVGFDYLSDDAWEWQNSEKLVNDTVDRIMNLKGRGYGKAGGGWFRSTRWKTIEIWYQMHEYLGRYI